VPVPDVSIHEAAEVAVALHQTGELLAARTVALEAANRELEQLARVDTLTGLQNRKSANESLHLEFLRFKRSGRPYCVLFMDIDCFKEINDTFGHDAGDQVLRHMATVLNDSLRETDFVARYGGEEFLAILSETTVQGALATAEIVRRTVAEQSFPLVRQVTVSMGVAMALDEDKNEQGAVRRADTALYQAKECGRNAVRSC
jgi:diguanylate cyclase (GGDEF)-like protein